MLQYGKEDEKMKRQSSPDNQSFWNRWAGRYDSFMRASEPLYDRVAQRMKKRLNRDMVVLELACGTGMISQRIVGSVRSLEATDFSPEMIAQAKKHNASSRLHYSVADATRLPYEADSFDAVVIANALHVMPQPEKALEEIRRVLKPGGLLLAPTFVHGEGRGFRLRMKLMEWAGFHAYFWWSAKEFSAFVAGAGFVVEACESMGGGLAPLCYLEARSMDEKEEVVCCRSLWRLTE